MRNKAILELTKRLEFFSWTSMSMPGGSLSKNMFEKPVEYYRSLLGAENEKKHSYFFFCTVSFKRQHQYSQCALGSSAIHVDFSLGACFCKYAGRIIQRFDPAFGAGRHDADGKRILYRRGDAVCIYKCKKYGKSFPHIRNRYGGYLYPVDCDGRKSA